VAKLLIDPPVISTSENPMAEEFIGCKPAYNFNGQLPACKREDFPHIPFAGMWDFPGGGRKGDESPEQ
jgi:8-oxo-dGTP diphosphatase